MKSSAFTNLLAVMLLLAAGLLPARAGIDKKFFAKTAESVWSQELPMFDPKADLSDSIFSNAPAVIIAQMYELTAEHETGPNNSKAVVTGVWESNAVNMRFFNRKMIKLNDPLAIEEFGTIEIPAADKHEYSGFVMASVAPAFGARIYKPDGRRIDVNIDEALTVTSGKKNRDESYKIAIPGLEPGDILEYFTLSDYMCEEMNPPAIDIDVIARYPQRYFELNVRTAPSLALEYGSYNGAPDLVPVPSADGKFNEARILLENVPSLDSDIPFFSSARQLPMIDLHVINYTGRMQYVPSQHRVGGLRKITYPYLLNDIAMSIRESKLSKKEFDEAWSLFRKWQKNNPQANERQQIDAAFLAVQYAYIRNGVNVIDDRVLCRTFYEMLKKLKQASKARFAVTSTRGRVPVDELVNFNQAIYFLEVGDSLYFFDSRRVTTPGDVMSLSAGEQAVHFNRTPDDVNLYASAEKFKLPMPTSKDNHTDVTIRASVATANPDELNVDCSAVFAGSAKSSLWKIMYKDWLKAAEEFFDTPVGKKVVKDDELEAEENRRENIKNFSETMLSEKFSFNGYELEDAGSWPGHNDIRLKVDGKMGEAVSMAGNNMVVNVGKLLGQPIEVKGDDRKRDVSAIWGTPERTNTQITLTVPEGYTADAESVKGLSRSVSTPEGVFFVQASVEGNDIVIKAVERYARAIYSPDQWPSLLKVIDASYDFRNASVVLRPN